MREHFLELIDEIFVLSLEAVDHSVFVVDVSLVLFDLVLEAVDLVVLDVVEFADLSLSGTLHVFGLALDESIVLIFLSLPSGQVFLGFSSQVLFGSFKV